MVTAIAMTMVEKKIVIEFYSAEAIFIVLDLEEELNCRINRKQFNLVTAVRNVINNAHKKISSAFCNTKICFVITKAKTLGDQNHVNEILYQYRCLINTLPFLRYKADVIYVDAVSDTVTDANGRLVPASGYGSLNLDKIKWEIDYIINIRTAPPPQKGCLAIVLMILAFLAGMPLAIFLVLFNTL